MKNLKKVLALVVALTMVLGTVCFAFTDVAEDADVYTAVQTLSSLSILNGYEDGTFGPEKDITRAEFAAVVCRALNMEGSANGAKGATPFNDVPADHWASGYINLAAGQKIVNGYGDGNFGPEDNVTYEQAVKMLVVALGFEPMAAQKGGFPTGYLVVANTYGMTKGVKVAGDSAAANRGVVAQLTYNALDIPMMEQTGFGTNVEYQIQDGEGGRGYKTLLTGLEVAKLDGSVTATPIIGGNLEVDQVEFTISDDYDSEDFAINEVKEFTVAEGVNAADYFGVASTIYVKELKANKWEIIAIMPGENSDIVTLDKGDIDVLDANNLKYYETEAATKTTNLKLDALVDNADIILNNAKTTLAAVKDSAVSDDAEIMVIENNGDSKYDMIVVKDYNYSVVEEVEADRDRFTTKDLRRFNFDFEDETILNNIVNKDGEAITLADFAEGDVIAYILEDGNKTSDFRWIEIINLGQNVVTGTVTETNTLDKTVYIDGVEYDIAASAGTIKVNDEGTFYLSRTDKVFLFDLDSSVASNYAYILEMGKSTEGFNKGWQFKLLTKEGDITVFDCKDTFTVDGTSVTNKEVTTAGGLEVLETNTNIKDNVDLRLITYKLDANNKIREIKTIESSKRATVGSAGNLVEFNGNTGAINGKVLEDDAVIFNVTDGDVDDAFVTGISALVHENEYAGYMIKNADGEWDAFIITEGAGAIDYTQDISVIDSINSITLDDDDAWKVRYYTANDTAVKEITLTTDTDVEGASTVKMSQSIADTLKIGTAFMFTAGEDGVVTNFAWIAKANNALDNNPAYTLNTDIVAKINADEDLEFIDGYIVDFTNSSKGVNIEFAGNRKGAVATTDNNLLSVTSATNAFTYHNRTSSKVSIVAGDWRGAHDIDKAVDGKATFFFAIAENGVASDIVTFSTRKSY